MDAVQNARLIANAEQYYRIMYYGSRASWNSHATATCSKLLKRCSPFMAQNPKRSFGLTILTSGMHLRPRCFPAANTIWGTSAERNSGPSLTPSDFGTNAGTVAAASNWDGPMEIKRVVPAVAESCERILHEFGVPNFCLDLSQALKERGEGLRKPRLARAIGVIYRPETELASHYFQAVFAKQFDEYVWFDETKAITPLETKTLEEMPDTYPFGL